jgi:RNA polymerase sigma-70 factor (ECF subfamily)
MAPPSVQLLAGLRPRLLKFAQSRLHNPEQAEDAVQETLLAALEGMDRFSGASSPATWLYGILKHKIVDRMRKSGREQPLESLGEGLPLPGSDPEEALVRGRFAAAIQRSLEVLPAKAARVFVLREVMGFDTTEICAELAISASNCWVLLHRARLRLRACREIARLAAGA